MGSVAAIVVSSFIMVFSLILILVSFSTDYWIIYDIDTMILDKFKTNTSAIIIDKHPELFTDRRRGLFRTCFHGKSEQLKWLESNPDTINDDCLPEKGYDLTDYKFTNSEKSAYGSNIISERTTYQRCQWSLAFLGTLFVLTATISCSLALYYKNPYIVIFTAIMAMLTCTCYIASMVLFVHINNDIEEKFTSIQVSINDTIALANIFEIFPKLWQSDTSPVQKILGPRTSDENYNEDLISIRYDFSFYCGWVGGALSFIAFLITTFTAVFANFYDDNASTISIEYQDHRTKKQPEPTPNTIVNPAQNPPIIFATQPQPQPQPIVQPLIYATLPPQVPRQKILPKSPPSFYAPTYATVQPRLQNPKSFYQMK